MGHSQGATQLFYGLAVNEEYFAKKISIFLALGPVTQLNYCRSPLVKFLSQFHQKLLDTCYFLKIFEIYPPNYLEASSMRMLCDHIPQLCQFGVSLFTDADIDRLDPLRVLVYLGHYPAGGSTRSLAHYGQMLAAGQFQRFDFGKDGNVKAYGQELPPAIPLQNIKKVPVGMFIGSKDELATMEDNRWVKSQVETVVMYKEYDFGHMSFLVGKDMTYFTEDVMSLLQKYHPSTTLNIQQ